MCFLTNTIVLSQQLPADLTQFLQAGNEPFSLCMFTLLSLATTLDKNVSYKNHSDLLPLQKFPTDLYDFRKEVALCKMKLTLLHLR